MLSLLLATALPELPPVQQQTPTKEEALLERIIKEGQTATERKFGDCHYAWGSWKLSSDGVRATSDKVTKADELVAAALKTHGGDRRSEQARQDQGSDRTLKRGDNATYIKARLQRDHPELAEALERGKIKSARAAAIEAGIIKDIPSIQLKDPGPTAQKLLAKKGQAWCLQLMEELSELVL